MMVSSLPDNSNFQKNLSSANEKIFDDKKPAVLAVVAVQIKTAINCLESLLSR